MTWQHVAVILIEALAVAFVGWTLFGRRGPKKKRGPDVPASRLTRDERD